ncbi:DUF554 domain-containing protein [Spirochaeta dissipatitropha]
MIATIINAAAIILGSLAGILAKRWIKPSVNERIFLAVGVFTIIIGMDMALTSQRFLYMAISLVVGGIIGNGLRIEDRLYAVGQRIKDSGISRHDHFAEGFLTSSVLFCVGAMAILGSLQAGAAGSYEILLTKSVMDGSIAILLAAAMGGGVALSAIVILIYQGGLTLFAGVLSPLLNDLMLAELTGTGGALILMIGLNLSGIVKIKTGDYLPAIAVAILLAWIDPMKSIL